MSETTFAWQDTSLSPRERAKKLVEAMTLEQKIAQLHGAMETIDIYALSAQAAESGADMDQLAAQIRIERHVPAIEELGIPRFRITNGPVGVGMGDGTPSPPATSLPMTIGLAAGFDPDLAHAYGDIIGSETATLGQHVLEGPGVCLHRTTIAGRNFEYFSEDPYLSGVMGVAVTKAIQAHDVIAMGKHYVVNDQEYERFRTSVEVDEHVLRELYLLPFEMLVKDAEIAAIMSSYNRVRGVYATEYRYTLTDILRTEWGFDGYVQSDFWSCRSCAAVAQRRHGPRDAGRQVAQRDERQGRPLTTPASRSRPSTVRWSAATPRCSGSDSSSARTNPARSTHRPTARSPGPSARRSPFCSRTTAGCCRSTPTPVPSSSSASPSSSTRPAWAAAARPR